jgi:hypothetical protein
MAFDDTESKTEEEETMSNDLQGKLIVYFISYTFAQNGHSGNGNVDVKLDSKIDSIDKIRNIEQGLMQKHDYLSVVISNFIELGVEDE